MPSQNHLYATTTALPTSNPEAFLKPSPLLYSDSVAAAKSYLDSLTRDLRQEQQRGQKRKQRTPGPQVPQLHVNGFSHSQIWEQAKRILDSALTISSRDLNRFNAQSTVPSRSVKRKSPDDNSDSMSDAIEAGESEEESEDDGGEMLELDSEEEEEQEEEEADIDENGNKGPPDEEDEDETMEGDESPRPSKKKKTDPHGLNDGFFSLEEFNKQSAFFENQDARRPHTEAASDEEDIDWDADPLTLQDIPDKESADQEEDDMDDDEEDLDMGMVDADSNAEDDDMELSGNDGRQARYEDFFDPPPNVKKTKSKPAQTQEDIDADIDRAMANVRRDLFDDDDMSGEDDGSDGEKSKNMSSHEKRRAQIADEIRRLEAANVAKKDWTLMGEAQSNARPFNSLIEEDLDFERVGKPVPIITTEVSNDIESLIKRRIITKEFDDIIRRRPLAIGEGGAVKRRVELDETKPQHSLAELYEQDHLRSTDPAFIDKGAEKLRKEHQEVIQLWEEISSQLDTLSNWHFKPKKPQVDLNVVSNVDTIFMEDAQPTTRADSGAASGNMAPHEIYNPGETRTPGEIKLKSGASLAKDELSKEAKLRHRRRREALKKRKRESQAAASKPDSASSQKKQLVSSLKKGGVKVIGKGGNLTDVQGNKVQDTAPKGRENLKL
ncbi:U3 snoRNP protein [Microsporum canis]|uniref:U3 small nucleolar ribonucleoprotein protein MPP10 n=1 Tax=Arthroderma otae (strain ATCC MYA-4605 / CBS 113480) TaxID=554155 RepID=C5FCB1_ARTOC|nr:U3 small nucleolar RNA-associated protein MPP10 [Microsporum canis CBS 113480]EEQ27355.1 U3 small nucleolar RNA-associated protein MPP10 [Microsporum canis CBS 113480]